MMANLIRREPYREMMRLREAMDHLFEQAFIGGFGEPSELGLPMDIRDEKDNLVVEADMPGFKPEEVQVTVSGNTLTLKAGTKAERDVKEKEYHLQERRHGTVLRSVTLPAAVKADQARAEFENGTLVLTLPKAEDLRVKSIPVKVQK